MTGAEAVTTGSTLISINAGTFLSIIFAGVFFLINVPIAWVLWGVVKEQKRLEEDNTRLDDKLDREIEHLREKHSESINHIHERHSTLNNKLLTDFARKDEVRELFTLLRGDIKGLSNSVNSLADRLNDKVDKS